MKVIKDEKKKKCAKEATKEYEKLVRDTLGKQLHILQNTKINALDKEFDKLFKKEFKDYCPFKKKYLTSYFKREDFYYNFDSNFVALFYFLLKTYYTLSKDFIDFQGDEKKIERALKLMKRYKKEKNIDSDYIDKDLEKLREDLSDALADIMKIIHRLWI